MDWTSEVSDRDWSRRVLILLTFAVVLNGCTSIVKQHYLRHLSTTIQPALAENDTVAASVPGLAVATASNASRP